MSKSVRNIKTIRNPINSPEYEIIIPCAGIGNRMKYLGAKSLIEIIPNMSIIDYQLKMIHKYLKYNPKVILVTGFEAPKVMNSTPQNLIHIENPEYETTNVVRSIGLGLRASTTNNIIIIYGDLLFNEYALRIPVREESIMVMENNNTMSRDEVGCTINKYIVEHIWYGLDNKWAQIIYLTGKELELFKSMCWNPVNYNKYTFEILNDVITKGGIFKTLQPHKLKAMDIDCPNDIDKARKMFHDEYSKF